MEFDDCQKLTGKSKLKWESETAEHIKDEFFLLYPGIFLPDTFKIWATINFQGKPNEEKPNNSTLDNPNNSTIENSTLPIGSTPEPENQNRFLEQQKVSLKVNNIPHLISEFDNFSPLRRNLQVKSPLLILFDVLIEFKSARFFSQEETENDIGKAFNSIQKQTNYITRLQELGDRVFATINRVSVKVNGIPVPIAVVDSGTNDPIPPEKSGVTLSRTNIIIIAVVTATTVLICFATICWYVRYVNKEKSASTSEPGQHMTTMIQVPNGEEDISTLGDPMCIPGAMFGAKVDKSEATGSVSHMSSAGYDYDMMAYGGTGDTQSISTAGGTKSAKATNSIRSGMESGASGSARQNSAASSNVSEMGLVRDPSLSLFSDDASFERQYDEQEEIIEIVAPPGKLGVVIDTPNGGSPIVHAIKDTSILADKIRVGDTLISVDDEDTREMSAIKVSRLISTRSQNPSRVLVFLRNKVGDQ